MTAGFSERRAAASKVLSAANEFLRAPPYDALRGHQIDDDARNVIKRIAADGYAAEAIVAAVPRELWVGLFIECIIAEKEARMHSRYVHNAQAIIERSDKARQALDDVAQYLGHPRSTEKFVVDSKDFFRINPEADAIHCLGSAIESKRRLAESVIERSSRKTTPDAGRARGIAWIKDALSLDRIEATSRQVAAIATAALGMESVTPEAARKSPGIMRPVRGC